MSCIGIAYCFEGAVRWALRTFDEYRYSVDLTSNMSQGEIRCVRLCNQTTAATDEMSELLRDDTAQQDDGTVKLNPRKAQPDDETFKLNADGSFDENTRRLQCRDPPVCLALHFYFNAKHALPFKHDDDRPTYPVGREELYNRWLTGRLGRAWMAAQERSGTQ